MELIRKSKSVLLGGLAGGFITLSVPLSPIGPDKEYFTLEELSRQTSDEYPGKNDRTWTVEGLNSNGSVIQGASIDERPDAAPLQRAVYRTIINE